MSQHKLTDSELDTFARYLWEHGDKRKLEAFRATFPDSKTADRSASAKAGEIYDREKVNIQLTIEGLQAASAEHSGEIGCDIEVRKEFCRDVLVLGQKAVAKLLSSPDADLSVFEVTGLIREARQVCDQLNKIDGSYAPEKIENLTAYGPVKLTRGPVGSKAPSAG